MALLTRPGLLAPLGADPGPRSGEHGVSLVETMIALLILSFVAVSTLAMFTQGMRLNASGADYTAITNIAKSKSEELLNLQFFHPSLEPDQSPPMSEKLTAPLVTITWRVAEHRIVQGSTDPSIVFSGSPMVSTTAAGSGNLKVIAVTVSSDGKHALGQRTVTVQSMMIDPSPPTPTPTPAPTATPTP
jgi:Tfp pilus assembly protein PilV